MKKINIEDIKIGDYIRVVFKSKIKSVVLKVSPINLPENNDLLRCEDMNNTTWWIVKYPIPERAFYFIIPPSEILGNGNLHNTKIKIKYVYKLNEGEAFFEAI